MCVCDLGVDMYANAPHSCTSICVYRVPKLTAGHLPNALPPYPLRQGLSVNPKFNIMPSLASQLALGSPVSSF